MNTANSGYVATGACFSGSGADCFINKRKGWGYLLTSRVGG